MAVGQLDAKLSNARSIRFARSRLVGAPLRRHRFRTRLETSTNATTFSRPPTLSSPHRAQTRHQKVRQFTRIANDKPNAVLIKRPGEVVDQTALLKHYREEDSLQVLCAPDSRTSKRDTGRTSPTDAGCRLCAPHIVSTNKSSPSIETFVKTGVVINCVNLATRTRQV